MPVAGVSFAPAILRVKRKRSLGQGCVSSSDDRTADEIRDLQARNIRVLSRRTIESYLLDDLILEAMCVAYGHPSVVPELLQAKVDALANSVANGGMPDDLKRAAGDIYNVAKRLFPDRKLAVTIGHS